MSPTRIQEIETIIADCEARGVKWTNLLIYEQVGGKYAQLSRYLKQRRAMQAVASTSVAVAEDPAPEDEESTQDATAAQQEHEESRVDGPPVPAPLPVAAAPDAPVEPCLAVDPAPRPIPKLDALQQTARAAEAVLARLTWERDAQQQVASMAALALHQARRDAHRLTQALRAAVRQAAATRTPHAAEAQRQVAQLLGHLALLVGETEAQRVAEDFHYMPAWLRR
jgi:hypothetical protein